MELAESGKKYHSQEFELTVHEDRIKGKMGQANLEFSQPASIFSKPSAG